MTRLVAILSNPPTTSGARTRARVESAREVLGFRTVEIANLFGHPTYRTGGISEVGKDASDWLIARRDLADTLLGADGIVLAYGCQEPSGDARVHYRNQLDWLESVLNDLDVPRWMIDGRPRHPSRWHRHTFAQHPELAFAEALPLVLNRVS